MKTAWGLPPAWDLLLDSWHLERCGLPPGELLHQGDTELTHRPSMDVPKLPPLARGYQVLNHLCLYAVSRVLHRVWPSPRPDPCLTGSPWLGSAGFWNGSSCVGETMLVVTTGQLWRISGQGSSGGWEHQSTCQCHPLPESWPGP